MAAGTTRAKDPLNPTLDEAFQAVCELVDDFEAGKQHFLSADYPEAQARKDFIDKFLAALGWDVDHRVQRNPYEQEVKVESFISESMTQRHPDYSLSLGPNYGTPLLYVEAKRPSTDIATDDNYFQVIRYANQPGHPLGILTSFAQLHVIDCRYQANIDTALGRGVPGQKYTDTDFRDPDKFAKVFYLISRPALLTNSLETFAARLPKARGRGGQEAFLEVAYKPVDERLLVTLDDYRRDLARMLKRRNPELNSAALTELTQRILDRLVFIRFLEDKLIEQFPIIPKLGKQTTVWQDFVAASRRLDKIYNGIVFRHHNLLDTQGRIDVDDKAFGDVVDGFDIYKSQYLFNAIPIHLLGSMYERFLGNVIVATAKQADLKPKPEVRKAGGVFYTPKYIVDYCVFATVGKLVEGKTPAEISRMRFADIACGSGSFLLGVYDYLLKYLLRWYSENPGKGRRGATAKRDGRLHLTLQEKSRILTENIYGVDIDAQAVEVAQLSLYLKLLEEETTASARQYTLEFHRPLLPSLADNIKCGNSLI